MIEQIDGSSFDSKVKKASRPVVVDFYGQQCPPCEKLLPILTEIEKVYGGSASFVKLDVGDADDVAAEYGVFSVPTLLFFKDGHPVDKITGLTSKANLLSRIQEFLSA